MAPDSDRYGDGVPRLLDRDPTHAAHPRCPDRRASLCGLVEGDFVRAHAVARHVVCLLHDRLRRSIRLGTRATDELAKAGAARCDYGSRNLLPAVRGAFTCR